MDKIQLDAPYPVQLRRLRNRNRITLFLAAAALLLLHLVDAQRLDKARGEIARLQGVVDMCAESQVTCRLVVAEVETHG